MRMRIIRLLGLMVLALAGLHPGARACSAFVAADGETVLVGNNEDFNAANTRMWTLPPEGGAYGRIYFGFDDFFPQGGVNEKGLFFDGFALDPEPVQTSSTKQNYPGVLADMIMARCATVEEAIQVFERYNRPMLERAQLLFGDARGDAVIIEGNDIIRKKGRFQAVTNFRQSKPEAGPGSCDRYRIATTMLRAAPRFDKALCRRILAAVHNEGGYPTLYSNIYDLKRGKIYLYHFHNFENEVEIDVAGELKKGKRIVALADLFPETFIARDYMKKQGSELEKRIAARRLKQADTSAYGEYVGEYLMAGLPEESAIIRITRQGAHLYGETPQLPPLELLPEGPDAFFYLGHRLEVKVTFNRDAQGKITGLTADQNGQIIPAARRR